MTPGVVAFETLIPARSLTRQDIARHSGVDPLILTSILPAPQVSVFEDNTPDWDYATQVARSVLAQHDVQPEQLGWIIYCGSGVWDTPFWSPAAKVAEQLGAGNAHCFEIINFCNAGATGISIACDKVAARPEKMALVIICDRLSQLIDHHDPDSQALFNFGDSASAVLIGAHQPLLTLLACEMQTDPSWCDMYQGQYQQNRVVAHKKFSRKGLLHCYVDMLSMLLERSLSACASTVNEVRFILINQGDIDVHKALLTRLELPPERSVFNYHLNGHLGGGDNWIALRQLFTKDQLHAGDIFIMATSAMGFSWGISVFKVER